MWSRKTERQTKRKTNDMGGEEVMYEAREKWRNEAGLVLGLL